MHRQHFGAVGGHDGDYITGFEKYFSEIIAKSTDNATELTIIPGLLTPNDSLRIWMIAENSVWKI